MSETLVQLLGQYGYALLFVTVGLMNAGVPLPGHLAYLSAAVLAGRDVLWLPMVMVVGLLAAILGAVGGYYLGRRGGRRLLVLQGPKVGLSAVRLARMDRFFDRHGAKAVFLTRFFVIIRTFGAICAGMNLVPVGRFLIVTVVGAVVWAAIFGTAGFLFGERWHIVEEYLGIFAVSGLGLLLLAGLAHVLWTRRRRGG